MQFTTFIAMLAAIATVSAMALPQDNSGEICPAGKQQACCKNGESGILGNIAGGACELNILGQNCAGNIQCCQVDSSGSLLAGSCAPAIAA